jgi:uncharacterized protein (TIGR02646 family)
MRTIQKGNEPSALRVYRAVPGATYDGKDFTPIKEKIREQLLRDQLHLCCYCLRRISEKSQLHPTKPDVSPIVQMKVEHWQSQDSFPHLQLAWTNLFGACLGGEGFPRSAHTCDTRKGERAIALNPLNPEHVATLFCTSNGRLESTNATFQDDIDERLGLNHDILTSSRRAILDRALGRLKVKFPAREFPASKVRKLINEMETPEEGKFAEFCNVFGLWARKRFGPMVQLV